MFGYRYESGEQHGKAFAFANDEEGFASLPERLRGGEPGRYGSHRPLLDEASRIASLVEHLDTEMAILDAEIARLLDPEIGAILQTIPGIGPACAATITAKEIASEKLV